MVLAIRLPPGIAFASTMVFSPLSKQSFKFVFTQNQEFFFLENQPTKYAK